MMEIKKKHLYGKSKKLDDDEFMDYGLIQL